ncbi:MAG: hypothetical protein JW778_04000 [Candidatus Altiarchaeota archaeon]|nr:hypothetical protein [Candidatus Altiarchaeota archaeon]
MRLAREKTNKKMAKRQGRKIKPIYLGLPLPIHEYIERKADRECISSSEILRQIVLEHFKTTKNFEIIRECENEPRHPK